VNRELNAMNIFNSPFWRAFEKQQSSISQMMAGILDSPGVKALQEQQNSIAKMTTSFIDSPAMKTFKAQQSSIAKMTEGIIASSGFKALQEQQSNIFKITAGFIDSPTMKTFREQQDSLPQMSSIFNSQALQTILDNIEMSEVEEDITKEEKNIIKEILQVITDLSPDIGILIKSFELQNYKKVTIFIIIWFLYNILPMYQLHNDILNSDTHYKVNRDNVRVRLSPNIENNKNVITKLSKNTYIEKLDSKDGWTKVRFEFSDGIEKEGWVYRTMLTKMD